MRKYLLRDNEKNYSLLKIILSISVPITIFYFTILCFSILILKTNISETIMPLMTIVASAVASVGMSMGITLNCKIKAIFVSLITTSIIIVLKLVNNLICGEVVRFSLGAIVGIICILIFSTVGSVIGVNIKK